MKRRSWWLTAIGVLVTAVMLFPVYWMINVSLTSTPDMRKSPPNLIPIDGTLQGYSVVLHQQLPYLGTSLFIGLGTVVVTLVLAAPAGYSLAMRMAVACGRPSSALALRTARSMVSAVPASVPVSSTQ